MRRAVLACCLMLTFGACGDAEDEATAPAGDPDAPVSSPADPSPPAGQPASPSACRRLGRRIVGDPLATATERAEARRCTLRVAVRDGEHQALTEDFQPARINVRIDAGVVTRVEFMG